METAEIFRHVDHTLLRADADWAAVQRLCEEALAYRMASVCIPASYVARAANAFGAALCVCTVIGFPLGYDTAPVKRLAARGAVEAGAAEVDMVINLGDVKNGDFAAVEAEIRCIKQEIGARILKVIVEACYLTQKEKIEVCGCVRRSGADFIKTSTGFGKGGATLEDILLFREHIGPAVRMKAAGGIRTRADMEAFLQAGCARLGTSAAISILQAENP